MGHYLIGGVKFHRQCSLKLSASQRREIEMRGVLTVRRRVRWPLPDRVPDFTTAWIDEGGTDVWGPGPYLKVPNHEDVPEPDREEDVVNRVFCPWGNPPDRLRIAWSNSYVAIRKVEIERVAPDHWGWILHLEAST